MTPDEMRAAFEAKLAEIRSLEIELVKLPLPDFFEHPCSCGSDPLSVITAGYSQWCSTELEYDPDDESDDPKPIGICAWTNGWGDMSDDGNFSYLSCAACGGIWDVPEDLEWT